jgi:hypothetical protein
MISALTQMNARITLQRQLPRIIHLVCTHNFPIFLHPHPLYASAHTPLRTYAKDRQSVTVNVDNATVDAVMVIINEYCSLYKCIK